MGCAVTCTHTQAFISLDEKFIAKTILQQDKKIDLPSLNCRDIALQVIIQLLPSYGKSVIWKSKQILKSKLLINTSKRPFSLSSQLVLDALRAQSLPCLLVHSNAL